LRNVYAIVLFLSTTFAWSQTFMVSGNVQDENANPIAYTNILLLRAQDSTIVSGTTSTDDGTFSFKNIVANAYIVRASFIGYEDNFTNITIKGDLKMPLIVLKESIESLSEIQLIYKKPTVKREVDRLVFNVEKTALSEGNMMEVLRSTPGVLVLNNEIVVKNSTPTVYINNRKVHLSSSEVVELLQGTSASNIKSVEVITNPPARYGAESGVVLNILMAKNLVTGYNGSVFSNYTQGVFPKTNYGMSNYFKGAKVNLFANYSYNNQKIDRVDREIVNYSSPNQKWDSNRDRNTWSENHNFNMNFDWTLNERNTLSLSTNTQFLPYFKYVTKSKTEITPVISDELAMFYSNNLSRDKKHNLGFDFDYVHSFKKDAAKLSINSHYTTYDYRRRQQVKTDYFLGNNSFLEYNEFKTNSHQDTEIITSQIDYSLPIAESGSFEIGAKVSNVKTESDILHNDIIGSKEELNNDRTDAFNYDETVYAGYVSYDKKWDTWSLSTGLRVEQTDIDAKSVSTSQNNNQNYLEWFPTINIGLITSEKTTVFVNYKRSIQRPNYSYLNPFRFYLNDNTYVTGNPNLRPIFTTNIKGGINIGNVFTIEAYYKKFKNNISEIPFQDNMNKEIAISSVNMNYTEEIGLDMEAYFNIVEKWSVYFGTSFYNYNDNATFSGEQINRDLWSNYTIMSNNISFLKDNSLTANLAMTYIHKTIQGFEVLDSRMDTNLSIRKNIFKGKGSLSLIISDLFNNQDYFLTTKFLDQNITKAINEDSRYIKLGFRYKFGNTKLSTNERSFSEEERERLKNSY